MAGAVIALSLLGLGAVQALPSASTLETRQIFIGDGSGVFVPFPDETLPPCLVSGSEAPQAPCLLPPIPGGVELPPGLGFSPKDKRGDVDKRQFWIGDGVVDIWPGNGAPKKPCLPGIPLKKQGPCIIKPGKEKRGLETRQTLIIGGGGTLPPGLVGGGGIPVCLTGVPLSEQPPCFLPPISGGGLILPPKEKREADGPRFVLPPDAPSNPKKYIEKLELELEALQNKRYKTRGDLQKIKDIKAALLYLVGITNISAPPGTGSTFTPGKRDPAFKLPPDAATNPKRVLEELEGRLIALQNKRHKTDEDREDIELIKAAILYVAGITHISAPPGTGSSFTPGKRDPAFKLPPDAATNPKRVLEELQGRLIALQNKKHKTDEDRQDIELIKAALLYVAGIANISAPPGTGSTFTPGKRDAVLTPEFDLQGLITSYNNLVLSIQGSSGETSSTTYLVLSQIADALELFGYKVDRIAPTLVPLHPKRQTNIITIGKTTCRGSDISGLKSALEALLKAYGDPSKAPRTIWFIQQVLVTALQLCGQGVEGWTTIIPAKPIPGGPIVPDPYVPGGPIKPDPYVPGNPVKPSD